MNILVTGYKGLLGSHLMEALPNACPFTGDVADWNNCLNEFEDDFDFVIHCAAYTNVDKAETEVDKAFRSNAQGTENIANACAINQIPMLYVSTEAVFDGTKEGPYTTWDRPNPISVYGKSKYAGELAIQSLLKKHIILRTNLIYGEGRNNFITNTIKACRESSGAEALEFQAIDQKCSPTNVNNLVDIIRKLIDHERWGVYHYTDQFASTRKEIIEYIASKHDKIVNVSDYTKAIAPRGKNSILDYHHLADTLRVYPFDWQLSLDRFMRHA